MAGWAAADAGRIGGPDLPFVIPGDGSAATRDPEQGGARERDPVTHTARGPIASASLRRRPVPGLRSASPGMTKAKPHPHGLA